MQKWLLCLGIILIPYYEVLCSLLPHKMISFEDTREHKMVLSLSIALIFSLIAIYKGRVKPFPNKWLLSFFAFVFINIFICPQYHFKLGEALDLGGFWNYQPIMKMFTFFLFGWAVYSQDLTQENVKKIISVMFWCGFVMAGYLVVQHFGLDQFYGKENINNIDINSVTRKMIGGTLGQPTIVSPYVAMLIPLGFYLKKPIHACFMILAVCLTLSKVAIVAMVIGLLFYIGFKNKKCAILITCLFTATSIFAGIVYYKDPTVIKRLGDNGRFGVWSNIVKDLKEPPFKETVQTFPLTGKGIGSYQHVFASRYKTPFRKAHNEYLQVLHDNGIVGLTLLLLAIGSFVVGTLRGSVTHPEWRSLMTSFIIIALCAGGTFVWQLGIFQYYTAIIVGLTMRRDIA